MRGWSRYRPIALAAAGVIIMLGAWELIGRSRPPGSALPPVSAALRSLIENRDIFAGSLLATLREASIGFVIGMSLGCALGICGLLVPRLRRPIGNAATFAYSFPWIALGPLVVMLVRTQATIPIVFAVLAVFFAAFISISSGFASTSSAHMDLLTIMGATKRARLLKVQLPAAVPSIIDGAKVAAPAAVLGAIFGEWFGSITGLGVLILTSMQNLLTDRLWAAAGLTALTVVAAFGLLSLLEHAAVRRFRE
jgi:ABC-type nitrate/sulfonate/bicarbonate transport system permease component